MRPLLTILLLSLALGAEAQSGLPAYRPAASMGWTDSTRKWSLQPYAAVSTGVMFHNRGGASYFSAPLGLQLTRKLNNNWYAFAGASIATTYMNFNNSSFVKSPMGLNPGMGYYNANGMNLYQRAELGLMYVNDAKTFSISGSIGIQRGGNPFYPLGPVDNTKPINTPISHR